MRARWSTTIRETLNKKEKNEKRVSALDNGDTRHERGLTIERCFNGWPVKQLDLVEPRTPGRYHETVLVQHCGWVRTAKSRH